MLNSNIIEISLIHHEYQYIIIFVLIYIYIYYIWPTQTTPMDVGFLSAFIHLIHFPNLKINKTIFCLSVIPVRFISVYQNPRY